MQTAQRALYPLVLILPFTAHAVPIAGDFLVVEYEGTISEIRENPPPEYMVGDPISGRLLIDRTLARRVDGATAPNQALYRSADPAFVSGFWNSSGDAFDEVSLGNDLARQGDRGLIDSFSVDDLWVVENGSLDGARALSVSAGVRGFLNDVSLDQSFMLTAADADEPEEFLGGTIRWSSIGPFAFVRFAIDKLKVKPGRCFAP